MHPSGCYHPALQLRQLQLSGQTACLAALLVQAAGRCLPAAPAAGSCAAAGVSGDQVLHVASWQPADLHCSQQHLCTLPHGTEQRETQHPALHYSCMHSTVGSNNPKLITAFRDNLTSIQTHYQASAELGYTKTLGGARGTTSPAGAHDPGHAFS